MKKSNKKPASTESAIMAKFIRDTARRRNPQHMIEETPELDGVPIDDIIALLDKRKFWDEYVLACVVSDFKRNYVRSRIATTAKR